MTNQRRGKRRIPFRRTSAAPMLFAVLEPRLLLSASYATLTLAPGGNPPARLANPMTALTADEAISIPADASNSTPVTIQIFDTATDIQVGDAITITALVTTAGGLPLDGQRIELWNSSPLRYVAANAVVSDGIATFDWIPAAGGLHNLTAILAAQDGYAAAASSPLALNVYRRAAVLSLQATTTGDATQLTVSASTLESLSFAPAGIVDFYDGGHFLDSVALGGSATEGVSLSPGAHQLRAHYRGSGAFFPADALLNFTVATPAPPLAGEAPDAPAAAVPEPPAFIAQFVSAPGVQDSINVPADSGSQYSLLSAPADSPSDFALAAAQSRFGLEQPEFRQFYEFQIAAASASGGMAPGIAAPDQAPAPAAGPALTPPSPSPASPSSVLPAAPAYVVPGPAPAASHERSAAFGKTQDGAPHQSA